ncbi:MAG: M48 family metallopeptidase [Pseudomonadota bacterium]
MDFFAAQARARQQSRLLSVAFGICLFVVVMALNAIFLLGLRISYATGANPQPMQSSLLQWSLAHPGIVALNSLLIGGFIGCSSLYRMLQLRQGGGYVARSVGGVRVERDTPDPRRRMLHNVVDEMALASGVPAPEVYVLEDEAGINAFAAGHTPANAAVTVTRGALLRLNRDQMQGVIAHEFSHILNGDMRLSVRLMGLVFGLMVIALAGRTLLRLAPRTQRGAVPLFVLGAVIAIIGQIGFWGGRMLQAWISRQREDLADASAVQFTRNPDGLIGALVSAAAMGTGSRFANASMEQVAHMLFVSGGLRLLATHPSLLSRLQALDPQINQAQFESMIRRVQAQWQRSADVELDARRPTPATLPAAVPAAAALIAASVGDPQQRHLDYAVALRHALPEQLRGTANAPEHARSILLGLVALTDPAAREAQLQRIAQQYGQQTADEVRALAPTCAALSALQRMPAALQLFPALRALPAAERIALIALLRDLARLDGKLTVFEYSLEKLVVRGLEAQQQPRPPHGGAALDARVAELGTVFAVLARLGGREEIQARRAYEAGVAPLLPQRRPGYAVIEDWVTVFDQSLDGLSSLHPLAKQLLVEGLVRTIAHDGLLAPEESELLRTICAVLECPLPPILPAIPIPG